MGRPSTTFHSNVFLNVPFDHAYEPLFNAMVFAVLDCGFRPRCALEIDDGAQNRLAKICTLIASCRYGVHDLSRVELSGHKLPRFNMPFELGLSIGAKSFGASPLNQISVLILDSKPYRHHRSCSDTAGLDAKCHKGRAGLAMGCVRDWLSSSPSMGARLLPGGPAIHRRYDAFNGDLPATCRAAHLARTKLTYSDFTKLAVQWIRSNPLT